MTHEIDAAPAACATGPFSSHAVSGVCLPFAASMSDALEPNDMITDGPLSASGSRNALTLPPEVLEQLQEEQELLAESGLAHSAQVEPCGLVPVKALPPPEVLEQLQDQGWRTLRRWNHAAWSQSRRSRLQKC